MYKSVFKPFYRQFSVVINGVREKRSYVDNSGDFTVNHYGFIRSQFSNLADAQSNIAFAQALAAMEDKFGSSLPDDMSFEDAVKTIRPRWCQSPAELDRFEQYCIDNALDFYKKLKDETPDDVKQAVGAAVAAGDSSQKSE